VKTVEPDCRTKHSVEFNDDGTCIRMTYYEGVEKKYKPQSIIEGEEKINIFMVTYRITLY